jgi:DUF4097 and DUF4098 domain-containing protein YvlB
MKKQTAVEQFLNAIKDQIPLSKEHLEMIESYAKQAKEMEKEKITEAYNKGLSFAINPIPKPEDAKNYYKKRIKKKNDTRRKSKGIV